MLKPPVFADEAKTRTAALLHAVVVAVFVTVVAIAADVMIVARPPLRMLPLALLGLAVLLVGVEGLMRRGMVTAASVVLIAGLWAGLSVTLPELGGVCSPIDALYLIITLVAGLLLGARGGVATAMLCMTTGAAFFLLERAGRLPPSPVETAPGTALTVLGVSLGLIVVLLCLFVRQLDRALAESWRRQTELAEINRLREQELAEQTRTAEALRETAARLSLAREVDHVILTGASFEEVARSVVRKIGRLIPCCTANLVGFDFDAGEARLVASHGHLDEPSPLRSSWPLAEFTQLETLRNGHPQLIADVREPSALPVPASLVCPRTRAWLRAPISLEGAVCASLDLVSEQPEAFSSQHQEVAAEIAELLTIALRQARLAEQVAQQVDELEDAVAERTAQLRRRVEEVEKLNRAVANLLDDYLAANRKLEATARQLQGVNAELEQFTYSASHDLRQPVRAIHGFAAAIVEDHGDLLPSEARHQLQRIVVNAARMSRLIDDLLMLSRVAMHKMNRQRVDLSRLAAEVIADLREQHPDRQVTVTIQPGLAGSGDPHLLRVVLDNLLGNAWKFTEKTSSGRIEFGGRENNGERVLFIRDNGAGFDMRYAEKLFQPFERLHSDREFPGNGVGLATVHRIIGRHGGRLWADGKVNGGATFYFTLPGEGDKRGRENSPAGGRQSG